MSLLEDFDPDQDVFFAHPSHDYWRSTLASEVRTVCNDTVKHSDYHRQHTIADYDDEDETRDVVVIS